MHVQLNNLEQLMILLCPYGPKSLRNAPSTWLNLCYKELRQL